MFRELKDLIIEGLHLLLLYGFLCVCAIGVITIYVANAPKNSPEVIYHVTHTSQIETTQRELQKSIGLLFDIRSLCEEWCIHICLLSISLLLLY